MDSIHSTVSGLSGVTEQKSPTAPQPSAKATPAKATPIHQPVIETPQRLVATDVDRSTGQVIGVFIDQKTGEVVDQVPSEAMLRLLAKTREMLGALFDEKI